MLSSLAEVAAVTGGDLHGQDAPVHGVSIDSRVISPHDLFVAFDGTRTSGHAFAAAAQAAGAAGTLSERPVEGPHVLVPECVAALGAFARHHRSSLGARVIGVTGSAGKTTVKDLLAEVLAVHGSTVAPHGSLNNDIGVPLTVLRTDASTDFLVVEMGARAVGDIARLCAISRPHVALVLNVGTAHLGEFGSRATIAAAKSELVEAATDLAVLNGDDPLVTAMAPRARGEVRYFGTGSDVRAERTVVGADGRASFALRAGEASAEVRLRLVGAHQVANALAVAAVALAEGMSLEAVAGALSGAEPRSRWRMEVRERADGLVIVNDAYNANPESMRAALDAAVALGAPRRGRVWAVLGPMLELGESSTAAHEEVGRYARARGVDYVVAVGAGARGIGAGAGPGAVLVDDIEAAAAMLRAAVDPGDLVLVKASRAEGLEKLAASLLTEGDGDERRSAR